MTDLHIQIIVNQYSQVTDLPHEEQELLLAAQGVCSQAYAPYSKFSVACAILLDNGVVVRGTNQENIAYPSGLCAERVAMFYANSQYPNNAIKTIVVVSQTNKEFNTAAVFPCGACRQALYEAEKRSGKPIRIIMVGTQEIKAVNSIADLLPLSFHF